MKTSILIIFFILGFILTGKTQVNQVTIGASNVTVIFNSVKYDASDGGTINVGYVNDPISGNGNDCFIVKLDASQSIVWQKIIPNVGDDYFNRVIICANGDYVVVGTFIVTGVTRGIICRVNKNDGSIIWSSKSNTFFNGENFESVIETSNGNFALAGYNYNLPKNAVVALLDLGGKTVWVKISSYFNTNFDRTINQLPNGNLIVGAAVYLVSNYNAIVLELDEVTGNIIHENSYSINIPSPNLGITLNSLVPINIKMINGIATFEIHAFENCCGTANMCIYTYDTTTKVLTGNIYYHSGDINLAGYAYTPVGDNDILLAQSFSSPNRVYLSRITGGSIIYDDLINNSVLAITSVDSTGINAVYSGSATYNTFTNTYNLFAQRTDPATISLCSITPSNTLVLQSSTLNPTTSTNINLSSSGNFDTLAFSTQSSSFAMNTICGSVLPLSVLNFEAEYNKLDNATKIHWNTSNTISDIKYFSIERSVNNGLSFTSIGSVKAKNILNQVTSYDFIDNAPIKGINLYRVKEVDMDNNLKYSRIVSILIDNNMKSKYSLTPNPSKNYTVINSNSPILEMINIKVFDAMGKLLKKDYQSINNNQPYKLFIKGIPGVYYIKIESKNSTTSLKYLLE